MKHDSYLAAINRRKFIRQAACAALGTAAMNNCFRDLFLINSAVGADTTGYKALVCIFLAGGNDSNNMIIPTIPAEYSSYASIRTPILAIPNAVNGNNATALALSPTVTDAHNYGLNPAMYELAQMFNQTAGFNDLGKVATLFNTGPLVFPMTKAQYVANSIKKPPQLFSHSDQVTQWQPRFRISRHPRVGAGELRTLSILPTRRMDRWMSSRLASRLRDPTPSRSALPLNSIR